MNPNPENELAAQIDRELKSLATLRAPASLAPRIMAAITAEAQVSECRAGWQHWPLVWRIASFVMLAGVFAGLCFVGWQATETSVMSTATAKVGGVFSLLGLLGKTLTVLGEAAVQVVRQLGTGFMVGAAVVLLVAYSMCAALGSLYVRFAFVRR